MKKYLLILSLIGLSFSCINISIQNNSNYVFSPYECYFDNDLNISINQSIFLNNSTVQIQPNQTIQDNVSGISYFAQPSNTTIINNTILNCSPLNQIIYLDPTQNYTNQTLNLSVFAKHANINTSIDPNSTYYNSTYNFSVSSKSCPDSKANLNLTLDIGANYTNQTENITINVKGIDRKNTQTQLKCGQSVKEELTNNTYLAPSCINLEKNINFDETYFNQDFNLKLFAPKKLAKTETIYDGQEFVDERQDLVIKAKTTNEQYLTYCKNVTDKTVTTQWQNYNLSKGYSRLAYVYVDDISPLCTIEEKFNETGLYKCFNRNLDKMLNESKKNVDDLNICKTERTNLETSINNASTSTENLYGKLMIIIVIVVSLAIICFAVGIWIWKMNREDGGVY